MQTIKLDIATTTVPLLSHLEEDVQWLAAAVLANVAKADSGRKAIKSAGGLLPLVGLLTSTNENVLKFACDAIYFCALAGIEHDACFADNVI